ncbi:carbohydrate ABC transporter permease [Diplocloster hominis]|uniref:carbohydrate ABC transporter permease n=1 Tax=Diplocloster hominis TaxID=3079010 RepID=UPI0031BB89EA
MKRRKLYSSIKYVFLAGLACLYLVPVAMMLLGSVKDNSQAILFDLSWPEQFHWENYVHVLEVGNILGGYKNSILITVTATLLTILAGALAGIVIGRRNDRCSRSLYYFFLLGLTMTMQTASTFALLKVLHIYGTRMAIICIYVGMRMPFTIMTFSGFVKGVPQEIDEAAIIDGCSIRNLIFRVLLPILKPIMMTNVVITAISVWNDFMLPLFFVNSSAKWTVPLTIYNFFGMYARDWNYVFAALTLTILPILILFLCLQKYIVGGMTAGAVKG